MKKIFYLTVLFYFIFILNSVSWNYITKNSLDENFKLWNILSSPFSSVEQCNEMRMKYEITNSSYTRSNCFINESKYYYFICNNSNSCNINTSWNNSNNQVNSNDKILDDFLAILESKKSSYSTNEKYIIFLSRYEAELTKLKLQYSKNSDLVKKLDYLLDWIKKLKEWNPIPDNNNNSNWCSWELPKWEWIISCWNNCTDFWPSSWIWTFSSSPTTRCTWWCANWYARPSMTSNLCVKSDSKIYNWNDVKIEVNVSNNCSSPSSSLSVTIWNASKDIKICKEYELNTPSRKWEKYNCDSDSKFVSAEQAWPNKYDWNKWQKYDTLVNHSTIVPGKYRLVVKSQDWIIKYWDWYTIKSEWDFSNPENCNYRKYAANSVEDAIWYILNTKWVHISYWIDFSKLTSKCPNIQTDFIREANFWSFWTQFLSPNIWWWWRVLWWILSNCYSREIPKWNWPTYIWAFWSRVNWEPNNDVIFDFQSWYNWWDPWTIYETWCWLVPNAIKSQQYWWIKWEAWKKFDCTNKTYWWNPIGWWSLDCTLPDWKKIQNNKTTQLYYKYSWNSCIDAIYICKNWTLERSSQFSPAPPKPTSGTMFFMTKQLCEWKIEINQSKTTLRENNDVIKYNVYWLDYENAKSCQTVLAHPYVPSAVSPNRCDNINNFVFLKNVNWWTYNNWIWSSDMVSNTVIYLSWIKVRSNFMNWNSWNIYSWQVVEIIK